MHFSPTPTHVSHTHSASECDRRPIIVKTMSVAMGKIYLKNRMDSLSFQGAVMASKLPLLRNGVNER